MSVEIKEMLDGITVKQKEALETAKAELEQKNQALEEKNAKLEEKNEEFEARLKGLEAKATAPTGGDKVEVKSLGQMLVSDEKFSDIATGKGASGVIEVKATTGSITNADAKTYSQRLAGVVELPQQKPTIYSALPKNRATSNSVEYIREKTFASATAETAENTAVPLSKIEFEDATAPVVTVGHHIKASEQQLADNTAVADLVDSRMASKTLQKVDELIMKGAGQLKGLNDATNHTVVTGVAGDKIFQSVRRGITALETDDFMASFAVLHPVDAQELDLSADTTGAFIAANPRAYNAPMIWGLPVIKSKNLAQGKFMLIDDSYVAIWERAGVSVEIGLDADDFTNNRKTIKANARLALTVYNKEAVRIGAIETKKTP